MSKSAAEKKCGELGVRTLAYAYRNKKSIFLCQSFWSGEFETQIDAFVHEIGHSNSGTDDGQSSPSNCSEPPRNRGNSCVRWGLAQYALLRVDDSIILLILLKEITAVPEDDKSATAVPYAKKGLACFDSGEHRGAPDPDDWCPAFAAQSLRQLHECSQGWSAASVVSTIDAALPCDDRLKVALKCGKRTTGILIGSGSGRENGHEVQQR